MNILVIEDDSYKFDNIEKSILKVNKDASITRRISQNGGVLELKENPNYDLVILDMQLPLFESGQFMEMFGGRHVLEKLKRCEINIPVCLCSSDDYDEDGTFFKIKYDPVVLIDADIKEMFNRLEEILNE